MGKLRERRLYKRSFKRIKLILFPLCTALNVEMHISLVLICGADTDTFGSDEHFRLGIKVSVLFTMYVCQTVRMSDGCQCDEAGAAPSV